MSILLVITLKQSMRRCLYRRWSGQVVGREVRTATVNLERMYRGNTPYPVGKVRRTNKVYASHPEAIRAFQAAISRRLQNGYRSC